MDYEPNLRSPALSPSRGSVRKLPINDAADSPTNIRWLRNVDVWQTDGLSRDVSSKFTNTGAVKNVWSLSVTRRENTAPVTRAFCVSAGRQLRWPLWGESQAGGIDESPDSWPAWVICQEFHYWTASNLWRGVFIVGAQITGGPVWSSNRRAGIGSWHHLTSNITVCRSQLSIKSTKSFYFYLLFG
jgi:hypothetical protein